MNLSGINKGLFACFLMLSSTLVCSQVQAAEVTAPLSDVQRLEQEIKLLQAKLEELKSQTADQVKSQVEQEVRTQVAARTADLQQQITAVNSDQKKQEQLAIQNSKQESQMQRAAAVTTETATVAQVQPQKPVAVENINGEATASDSLMSKTVVAPRPSSQTGIFELTAGNFLRPTLVESDTSGLVTVLEHDYHGPSVVTSPALGKKRSAEDARDLITFLPSINDDLAILQYRRRIQRYLTERNVALPERPVIALSGRLETEVGYRKEYDGGSSSNVDLSSAELDVMAEVSPWVTAMMMIGYDSGRPKGEPRINNSRLRLDKGYITIGNLERTPFYFSVGQMYAPFGTYSSYRMTDAPTKIVGRTKDRLVVIGCSKDLWEAQIFGLGSELRYQNGGRLADHLGANIAIHDNLGDWKYYLGASYTGALAESKGILVNVFDSRSDNDNNITLYKKVRGVDLRGRIGYKNFTLLAEYVGALGRFDERDIMFNGKGAKPRALEIDAAYSFDMWGRPSTFALGWGQSWDALVIKLPRSSLFATYSIAILKNTILGLEYRHDINYKIGTTASSGTKVVEVKNKRHQNVYTMKLGVYF